MDDQVMRQEFVAMKEMSEKDPECRGPIVASFRAAHGGTRAVAEILKEALRVHELHSNLLHTTHCHQLHMRVTTSQSHPAIISTKEILFHETQWVEEASNLGNLR